MIQSPAIDDYTLAAFVGGTLPAGTRQQVIEHLAQDADAQALLSLVGQALEAANDFAGRQYTHGKRAAASRRPHQRRDRAVARKARHRFQG